MRVAGAKNDLKNSLNKLDELNYVVEAMISSSGTYWKGSLTPKANTSDTHQTNKIINHRGVGIYHGKMVETCHVVDGCHQKYKKRGI
jgi:hypothetical protein